MQYAIWNNETHSPTSIMQQLPDHLNGATVEELNSLGYLELLTQRPEDYIPRFAPLSGPSRFTIEGNRIIQDFPEADFSLASVRKFLLEMAAKDAGRVLFDTDWYVIRKYETGREIPEEVVEYRAKVRDHLQWIESDIEAKDARSLVEYKWAFPTSVGQILTSLGAWIDITGEGPQGGGTNPPESTDPLTMVTSRGNLKGASVPREFNSSVVPLQVEVEGTPVTPPDAADITPIAPNGAMYMRDSGPEDPVVRAPFSDELAVPEEPLAIERMDEEARQKLDPEVRARLEQEHIEKMLRERGAVPIIRKEENDA